MLNLKKGDKIAVLYDGSERRAEYDVLCESTDGGTVIVSEGPGLSALIHNNATLGSYTFDGFKVHLEKI